MTAQSSWSDWLLPYIELSCAAAAGVLAFVQLQAVVAGNERAVPWALIWFATMWVVRLAASRRVSRPSAVDALLWLFIATAGLGVWAAYDPSAAWAMLWVAVAAVSLYYAIAHQPDLRHLYGIMLVLGLFGGGATLVLFASNDWAAMAVKVPTLASLGARISTVLPPISVTGVHPNAFGGLLAALVLMCVPLATLPRNDRRSGFSRRARRWIKAAGLAAGAVSLVGWLFSMSRGAWVALAGAAGLWLAWRLLGWWVDGRDWDADRAWRVRVGAMAAVLVAVATLGLIAGALILTGRLPGTQLLAGRLNILRSSLLLAGDTVFTGGGLGTYSAQHPTYTLLTYMPYTPHSHNLFVGLLLNQGIVGLLSYLALVITIFVVGLRALREASRARAAVIEAGLAFLVLTLAHGLFDDPDFGGTYTVALAAGLVMGAHRAGRRRSRHSSAARPVSKNTWALALVLTAVLMIGTIVWLRPLLGAWYADLGAVAQARVELTAYDPDRWDDHSIDMVRREVDLDGAVDLLERAVALDPANRTARQRLAGIALSRGQHEAGLSSLEAAWAAGHRDDVTRLLFADALVATGQPDRAAETVRGVAGAETHLMGQAWYRYWINDDHRRAADAWRAVAILNPDNEDIVYWLAQAEARAGEATTDDGR